MLDKQTLIDLYVNKKLTTREIGKIYNVDKKTVSRHLKKHGIQINFEKRKFEIYKKRPLTGRQKEIVIGTVLGDGCIAKHGKLSRLVLGQCEKQKNFLYWKANELGISKVQVREGSGFNSNSVMYCCNSYTHSEYEMFRKKFYRNNKKIIPNDIVNYMTPLSLAVWIMDDGSLCSPFNIRISTDCFSYQEHLILKDMLKIKFDLNVKICEYSRRGHKYNYLSFNKRNSLKLEEIIKPHILDCMKYKLPSSRLND